MDGTSPWMDPRFLFTALSGYALLVMWLARMEFKTNANATRQQEHEKTTADEIKAVKNDLSDDLRNVIAEIKEERAETREWKKAFYAHATDTKLHHNEEMFREFRTGIDRRFSGMESTLGDMNRKLDHLAKP